MDQALTTYGAVVFDDATVHDGAWVCHGTQAPYRITGTIEVPDDRILWTNVDPAIMRNDGLSARFRGADWGPIRLGEPWGSDSFAFKTSILSELGWAQLAAHERASRMASLIDRWMAYARAFFPAVADAHKFSLAHTLRLTRPKDVIGLMSSTVMQAATMAYTFGCAAERPPGAERFRVTGAMIPPRYDHAKAILSGPVPENGCEWRRIPRSQIPRDNAEVAEWVESRGPLLLQMVVDRITHPVAYQLLNPAGETTPEMGRRLWRTGDEAIAFSTLGEVRINDAFEACASKVPWEEAVPPLLRGIDESLMRSSPSMGLFMTALQKSFMVSDVHFNDKKLGYRKSPAEVFLRARDMLICAQHAIKLHQSGAGVVWYGSSSVQMSLPSEFEDAKRALFDASIATGMMAPAGVMPEDGRDAAIAAAMDDAGLLRYVLMEGDPRKIEELDATLFENIMDRVRAQSGASV